MKIQDKLCFLALLGLLLQPHFSSAAGPTPEDDSAPKPESAAGKEFFGSYLSGRFAQSNGDTNDAIRFLREAYASDPHNIEVASELEATLLLDGQIDDAVRLAASIRASGHKDAITALLLTLQSLKKGDIAGADAMLAPAFDTDGNQLWLPLVSAWLDVGQKRLNKPVTLESLSADVGRATSVVSYHLALINSAAGYKDAATQDFKAAIEDPKNPPARVMEALLQYYKNNDSPEALTPIVNAYREANPDSDLDENTPVVTNVQQGVAEVLLTMGSIMLSGDATQDAAIYLRLALYLRPDFPVAAITLGDVYSELHEFAKSNETYATIPAGNRLYESAQLHVVMNYDRMGKLPEALHMLDAMNAANPNQYEALVARGDLLRGHGKFNEAADAYTQALKRVPTQKNAQAAILFARGACYERQGKWPLAEADLKQALIIKPDDPEMLNYLGYSWLERGQHLEEARDMIAKAIAARPNDAEIADSMGWAMFMLGQYNDATTYLEKAVELLPADPTVNDHLGDAYWRQGRKTEARYQWERSLTFSPEAAEASILHRKLKEGLPPVAAILVKPPVMAQQQPAIVTP